MPQAEATALTPALCVMQRGTRFPAARVLACRPHARVAPPLAAALVTAQGGQSPGTPSASVQVSPGSPERGAFPGGPQVQRLGSLSPAGHFTRLARKFSPFPIGRAVSERGGGLLRRTGVPGVFIRMPDDTLKRTYCYASRTHLMACVHTCAVVSAAVYPRCWCCSQPGTPRHSPGRVPRVSQSESRRHFLSRAHVQAGPAPWFSLRS